jgi:glycosyltransferase involved in cell wall biosynthesis
MAYRRAEKKTNPLKRAYLWSQARKLERLEREMCAAFDVNLAVSHVDAEILRSRCPSAHFHIVENGTDTDYFHPSDAEPEPNTLVFAGSLDWYPNISGLRSFVRNIWPVLKERCPGVRLYLAGRSPGAGVVELAESDPAIHLVADPADIRPWIWKASVFICPIIDGGGTRLKILDALAMGKAVVTTTIGREGLLVEPGESILVADTPEEFAQETLRAMREPTLRDRLGAEGRAMVERCYAWEVVGRHLESAYQRALELPAREF